MTRLDVMVLIFFGVSTVGVVWSFLDSRKRRKRGGRK